jgi:tetratricopeptide (TPR) repeat protein
MKNLSITFLTFSPNGKELLVNLGGEQLYLYDLSTQSSTNNNNFKFKHDSFRRMLTNTTTTTTIKEHGFEINMDEENCLPQKKTKVKLPPKAESLKQKANSSFEEQNYLEAIEFYNRAIQMAPDSPILYGNRAAALMKRNWDGDVYMAMLDCYQSLSLDSMHLKSHFRLAKCLNDLKWHDEANDCLKVFCKRFPDYAKTNACENLLQEIQHCLSNLKKIQEKAKYIEKNRKLKSKLKNYTAYMSENYNRQETEPTDETSTPDIDMTRSDFFHDTTDEDENDENESSKISPTSADNNGSSGSGDDESKELHLINESMQKTSKKPSKSKLMLKEYKQLKVDANDLKSRYCGHCNVATDIKEANFLGDHFICAGSDDGSFFIWDKATSNVIRVLKGDESIVNCLQPHPFAACLATSGIDPCVRIWAPKRNQINGGDDDDSSTTTNDVHVVSDVRAAVLNNQTQMNSHPFEFLFLNLNNQNRQNFNDDDGDDTSATQQSVACRPS